MSQSTTTTSGDKVWVQPVARELTGDALQVRLFLEWAYSAGVEVSAIGIGTVTVNLAPRRATGEATPIAQMDAKSIYEKFGGKPYADIANKPEAEGEYEPAIGRK